MVSVTVVQPLQVRLGVTTRGLGDYGFRWRGWSGLGDSIVSDIPISGDIDVAHIWFSAGLTGAAAAGTGTSMSWHEGGRTPFPQRDFSA